MVIVIIGPICAGKSTVRRGLEKRLGIPSFAIDDYRKTYKRSAWKRMVEDIGHSGPCISESCIIPASYQSLLRTRPNLKLGCTATETVRRKRIHHRGYHSMFEHALYGQLGQSLGHADGIVDTSQGVDIDRLAIGVRRWMDARGGT